MRLRLPRGELDLCGPLVMGVLNVTPDSFSDGGAYPTVAGAVERAQRMLDEGAALIDVGGESTRPGAAAVSVEEELRRVVPVLEALARRGIDCLSVDTSQPLVMRAAAAAGAQLINDVRALAVDGAIETVRQSRMAVCLMHMQGEPATMQRAPQYADVVGEVCNWLADRARTCVAAGIARERLCVDPGFGFGKTLQHNLALLHGLPRLAAGGLPVLVGMSRKRMALELAAGSGDERLIPSLTLAAVAVLGGANIIRAHDVAATRQAVQVAARLRAAGIRWDDV